MKEIFKKDDKLNYCSLEDLLANIDTLNFRGISFYNSFSFKSRENEDVCVSFVNEENPIAFGSNITGRDTLFISREYYLEHKDYIDNMLAQIISKTNSNYLRVTSNELTSNDAIIKAILENQKIENISLYGLGQNYILTEALYKMAKESGHIKQIDSEGVSDSLKDNYDSIIRYNDKAIFEHYNYTKLTTLDLLRVDKNVKIDEIKNLKFLNDAALIRIDADDFLFEEFFNEYNKLNKNHNFEITINDKNKFNSVLFENPALFSNYKVTIKLGVDDYDLNVYKEYEERLYKLIEPALNLSPLERYLYAYNIVKQYKPYKENEEDKDTSRRLYDILDNDYMVCVGYSIMLVDLLDKLGIKSQKIGVSINLGMDGNPNLDMVAKENSALRAGHARVEVRIDDSKYNVHGIYTADPTWDNDMEHDLYTYALLTKEEYDSMRRMNFMDFDREIFDASSLKEYFEKVNFVLNKYDEKERNLLLNTELNKKERLQSREYSDLSFDDLMSMINDAITEKYGFTGDFHIGYFNREMIAYDVLDRYLDRFKYLNNPPKEIIGECLKSTDKYANNKSKQAEFTLLSNLLNFLEKFNYQLYENIINKYPGVLRSSSYNLNSEEFADIITCVGDYIVSINNNKVNAETIYKAAIEVYKANGLSSDEIRTKMEDTIQINLKYAEYYFPKFEKINQDDEREIYMNEENKFDIESKKVL